MAVVARALLKARAGTGGGTPEHGDDSDLGQMGKRGNKIPIKLLILYNGGIIFVCNR
jgi:hypothetical protein